MVCKNLKKMDKKACVVKIYRKFPRLKTDFTSQSINDYMKNTFCAVTEDKVKFGLVEYRQHFVNFEEYVGPVPKLKRGSILVVHFQDNIEGKNVLDYVDYISKSGYYFLNCLEPLDKNPFEISKVTTWLFRRSFILYS